MLVTGLVFSKQLLTRAEIESVAGQRRVRLVVHSKLNFGGRSTTYNNRFGLHQRPARHLGGATSAADYPDQVWQLEHMGDYFDQFDGASTPNFTDDYFGFELPPCASSPPTPAARRQGLGRRLHSGGPGRPAPARLRRALYRQPHRRRAAAFWQGRAARSINWSNTFDRGLPAAAYAGGRYEETKIVTQSPQPAPVGINWAGAN